ncbi:hypothetical protein GCM10017788_40310 [Amycolatopsis acidiphila]|nr:hypothetical protein GCM10017788_40310 [Amycolatopsis acidiphila]
MPGGTSWREEARSRQGGCHGRKRLPRQLILLGLVHPVEGLASVFDDGYYLVSSAGLLTGNTAARLPG